MNTKAKRSCILEDLVQAIQVGCSDSLPTLIVGISHEMLDPIHTVCLGTTNLQERLSSFRDFLLDNIDEGVDDHELQRFKDKFRPLFRNLEAIFSSVQRMKWMVEILQCCSQLGRAQETQTM